MHNFNSNSGLLFVLPWDISHPGGVNQVVINLFHQAQQCARWRPMVCINKWDFKTPEYLAVDSRPTVYFRLPEPVLGRWPWLGILRFLAHLIPTLARLRHILADHQISAVNIHYPALSALAFIALKMLGGFRGNLILSFHGADITNALKTTGLERKLWHILVKYADAITACSGNLKQRLADLDQLCLDKTTVIHNGLDENYFYAHQDQKFSLEQELEQYPYILNLATFESKKGQDTLIDAFRIIADEFPDLILVLAGRVTPTLSTLRTQVQHQKLEHRVFFYENIPHSRVSKFLKNSVLFCLPSREEPFGIVLLEAGLFSLPVVATRVGGIPEIILDQEHGYLVAPDDPAALASALRDLLRNPETATKLGQQLNIRVAEHFTWVRAFSQYEQLFDQASYSGFNIKKVHEKPIY